MGRWSARRRDTPGTARARAPRAEPARNTATEAVWLLLLFGRDGFRPGEADLLALFDLAATGLAITDRNLLIQRANPAAERLFHVRPGELVGLRLSNFLTPASVARLDEHLGRTQPSTTRAEPLAVAVRAADRSEVLAEVRIARLGGGSGGEYAVAIRDLRERSALVEALAEQGAALARSNDELQNFVQVASHDLQEPLRMIASYTELVNDRYGRALNVEATEFLGYARDGARRMQQLLDALLAYSRLDRQRPPPDPVLLDACLDGALDNLRLAITEAGARILRDPLPIVEGDRTQFIDLFQNLVGNALKFRAERPPEIRISARNGPDSTVISVQDNGIGILPDYHDRVFVIFQRLNRREEYPGTGIGLAISKKIVERHGGAIWVESTGNRGEGATFRFRLPYHQHPAPRPPPEVLTVPTDLTDDRRLASELIAQRLRELA